MSNHPNRSARSQQITQEIKTLVQGLGFYASPFHVKRAGGYTQRQIELAVARGALKWNRDGSLSIVE